MDFKCRICNKEFMLKNSLNKHLKGSKACKILDLNEKIKFYENEIKKYKEEEQKYLKKFQRLEKNSSKLTKSISNQNDSFIKILQKNNNNIKD